MSPAALRIGKYVCGLRLPFFSISILLLFFEFLWRPHTGEQYLQRYAYHSLRNPILDDWFYFQSAPLWFSLNMLLRPAFSPTQQTRAPVELAEEMRHCCWYLDIPWLLFESCTVVFSNRLSAEALVDGLVPCQCKLGQDLRPLPRSGHDTLLAGALWTVFDEMDFSRLC
jgi:hypothetical protein